MDKSHFIVVDLSNSLTDLTRKMLETLRMLTNDSISIVDNCSHLNLKQIQNKCVLIFTTKQFYNPNHFSDFDVKKCFLLQDQTNQSEENEHFNNVKDLIFELADQLYRIYRQESIDDLNCSQIQKGLIKEIISKEIYIQLENLYKQFHSIEEQQQAKQIQLIWLKFNQENKILIKKLEEILKGRIESFVYFDNADDLFNYFLLTKVDYSIYLIIDNEYNEQSIAAIQQFNSIEKMYRYSTPSNKLNENYRNKILLDLVYDLILHYNHLANRFQETNQLNNAKQTLAKACSLTKLIPDIILL